MNSNTSIYSCKFFFGLALLFSFSQYNILESSEYDSRDKRPTVDGKKMALLVVGLLASTVPQEVNGIVPPTPCYEIRNGECVRKDDAGKFTIEFPMITQEVKHESCDGFLLCATRRLVKKYDNDMFEISCVSSNPYESVIGKWLHSGNTACHKWICKCKNSKKKQRYDNATIPTRQKFPRQKRGGKQGKR